MLNRELIQFEIDPEVVLKDEVNLRLLSNIRHFVALLERFGYQTHPYSKKSLLKLSELSTDRKNEINNHFESCIEWISPLDPRDSFENEIIILKRALDKFGYRADPKFFETLEEGQIVEFYGENMIQLYRSFNFFAITGYSVLDISIFEWYLLWDRPKRILENIANELNEALDIYIPAKRFKSPKHIIREIHNVAQVEPFQARAALAEFLHLGSLRSNKISEKKKGFICSSFGELVAIGKEAELIQFI